jgi:E3 ubiquitin-protein ligase HECTD1
MLFPFDTRLLYFHCTAFGASRSIVWLQNQRDQNTERSRGGLGAGARGREELLHEFRVGRIKHERVKVPRGDNLLDWAIQVMRVHADRKAILEVEFMEEEGTGLGPTLEFFALVAAELQRKDLAMWICDDHLTNHEELDMGEGKKPPGYYVVRPCGLFPAPLPQDSEICLRVTKLFWFLGVFLAKTLQDNRLVDLPLSYPFLKLLCQGEVSTIVREKSRIVQLQQQQNEDELMTSSMYSVLSEESDLDTSGGLGGSGGGSGSSAATSAATPWFSHLLGGEDLVEVDHQRGEFLSELQELIGQKQTILARSDLSEDAKTGLLETLTFKYNEHEISVADLSLTFQFAPSSSIFGFGHVDLVPNGEHEMVTIHNIEDYVDLMTDFTLRKGIRRQLEAFRNGFNQVFSMDKLGAFSPQEIKMMLCGDQCPVFTKEDIIRYTEPKLGYTRESPAFLKFVNVLVDFDANERKAFLQFTTGCSSLPPGMSTKITSSVRASTD